MFIVQSYANNCRVTWHRPRPLSGKIICAPARHFRYKAAYQIWSLYSSSSHRDILRSKRIGVTSLTFQGHVTSSVTWPFGSPYTIYYWWSFGTKPLSLTVSEIFDVKSNAMVDVTLIRPLNKGLGHSFCYQSISHIRLPMVYRRFGRRTIQPPVNSAAGMRTEKWLYKLKALG